MNLFEKHGAAMRSGILHQAGVPGGRLFGVERHLILGHFDCRVPQVVGAPLQQLRQFFLLVK
jgi:hypothetical protein